MQCPLEIFIINISTSSCIVDNIVKALPNATTMASLLIHLQVITALYNPDCYSIPTPPPPQKNKFKV